MYYLSREMHAQIQEIMWWVGGGGGGAFLFASMPLAYTVPKSRNASLLFRTLG